jgi:hypothetical protein
MGGDRKDQYGISQLVEEQQLCLLHAWRGSVVRFANTHSRPQGRARWQILRASVKLASTVFSYGWLQMIHRYCCVTQETQEIYALDWQAP